VDVLWASGLAGSALLSAFLGDGALWPRVLLALCGGLWGARLAVHLWRRVRAEPEDGRYRHLRESWHGDQRKWFGMFQFQACLVALFSVPFVIAAANTQPQAGWVSLAVLI
jgi:steroid 5-alpha reductase family enzyme